VRELVGRTLAEPDRAGVEPERRQRFGERDLGGLADVERAAHDRRDRGEAVQLVLAGAVLLLEVVEVAPRHARCQTFDHVLDAALSQGEDLVPVRLALQRSCDQLDRGAPVDREHVDDRLQRHALRGAQPAVLTGTRLVLGPLHLDVAPQRSKQSVDESRRSLHQVFAGLFAQFEQLGRPQSQYFEGLPAALCRIRCKSCGECTEDFAGFTHERPR
jgi:hypothetical protein